MKAYRLFYMGVVQKLQFLNNFLLHKVKEKRMNNTFKFLKAMQSIAIAALLTATALAVFGCNNGSTGGGGGNDNVNTDSTSNGGTISGSTIVSGMTVKYDPGITNMADAKARTDFSNNVDGVILATNTIIFTPLNDYINTPASATINNEKVTINLGTPKREYMDDMSWYIEEGLTVTPSSAKVFLRGGGFTTIDGKYILLCMKDENNFTMLVYADRDVTIRGTSTSIVSINGNDATYTDIYNVSLKKGWNYFIESQNDATKTFTYTAATTLPSGFYWTVIDDKLL
jgi:hypothetical protein